MKKGQNKMVGSTESTVEKVEKKATKQRSYTFPKEGITIQANSLEEAQAKLAKNPSGDDE